MHKSHYIFLFKIIKMCYYYEECKVIYIKKMMLK